MRFLFRVDASLLIGAGHVMRCLTLADALRERGAKTKFVCRQHTGNLIDLIEGRGHEVAALPVQEGFIESRQGKAGYAAWLGVDWATDAAETCHSLGQEDADWVVVDHYAIDRDWEQVLRSHCRRLMVIDDLADRPHDCDVLLDQNLGRSEDDYRALLPDSVMMLIGPQFALLRPEFLRLRAKSLARRERPTFKRVLITMGGVDKDNVTGQVLDTFEGCQTIPQDLQITVVMGHKAPHIERVRVQAAAMRFRVQVLVGVSDMASLMTQSDLAIGAAGGTSWERCCLGLPSLILVLADNQKKGAMALQEVGAALAVERVDLIENALTQLLKSDYVKKSLYDLSRAAAEVTDGTGLIKICDYLMARYDGSMSD